MPFIVRLVFNNPSRDSFLHSHARQSNADFMAKTRLYVECPNCQMQCLIKDFDLVYSNGAYIENVAGTREWQRLLCPCRPGEPFKFKLSETQRLRVFSDDQNERTHFSLKKSDANAWASAG